MAVPTNSPRFQQRPHRRNDHRGVEGDVVDGVAIARVRLQERAGWPAQRRFGCHDPAGEVGHPGRSLELDLVQPNDGTRHGVEERAEDGRPFAIERGPELGLILAAVVRDARQFELDRVVDQIAARAQDADAVDDDRAAGVEQGLFVVLVQGAGAEAQAGRDPAERVAEPVRDGREVVEGDDRTVGRCDPEITLVPGCVAGDARVGVDQACATDRRCGSLDVVWRA